MFTSVFEYHESTRHHFESYAPGPGYLDWATQPNPFRRYAGARLITLEQGGQDAGPAYAAVFEPDGLPPAATVDQHSIARLFYDSLALSAWKSAGANRWALRVNASSGNLHPTEGYLVCGPVDGLCTRPMVAHYAPKPHALEVRAEFAPDLWERLSSGLPAGSFFLGLASIHWREAWKYGQRGYRYCMHDVGHALGAISFAAAALGWQVRLVEEPGSAELASLLGTSQPTAAEPEEPDLLLACVPGRMDRLPGVPADVLRAFAQLDWQGTANQLSPAHVDWGMESIAALTRKGHGGQVMETAANRPRPGPGQLCATPLRRLIRQRRSAVAMDGITHMPRDTFYQLLAHTLAVPGRVPFCALPWKPRVHPVLMVHRVEDVPAGLYLLVRDPAQRDRLEQAITRVDAWTTPPACPDALPLYCLRECDTSNAARAIACHQEIASDGCFSLAMLAEFRAPLERYGGWMYPRLFWEAGMLGQLLYLEAEAAGLRATGIGCYFDNPMHELLGLAGTEFQDLYHFTVGGPVEDTRLTTLPAYG